MQPEWITQPLSPADIAAILQGGCASGAYMPAVTYSQAVATMSEHGDEVVQYLEDYYGDHLPAVPTGESWSGLAVFYLSAAVEAWAYAHEDYADWDDDNPIDDAA